MRSRSHESLSSTLLPTLQHSLQPCILFLVLRSLMSISSLCPLENCYHTLLDIEFSQAFSRVHVMWHIKWALFAPSAMISPSNSNSTMTGARTSKRYLSRKNVISESRFDSCSISKTTACGINTACRVPARTGRHMFEGSCTLCYVSQPNQPSTH
ncbi:hypothetical protein BDZ97DRAFT_632508 [Flammula alnicola]|nr:hypothetical protein BDZ97DRAFT_632508 [Flammula alnicola]